MVHSSVKSIGECENRGDTILDAFTDYMKDGLLIFPTHTWTTVGVKSNVYDPLTAESCVGVLTNLFCKRPNVLRSLHPTHSVAAIGSDAADFVSGEELTKSPCSKKGCYGKLYDRKAQILFIGCDLSKNTFIHCIEECHNIPNRLSKEPYDFLIKKDDGLLACPQYRHDFVGGDVSRNYVRAESMLTESGAVAICKIGDADCILCDAVKTADVIGECLVREPNFFD